MRKIIAFFSIFCVFLSYAQKTVDGNIITINNDTIKARVIFAGQTDYTNAYIISKEIRYYKNDKLTRMPAKEIREFYFRDFAGRDRFFKNIYDDKRKLVEVLYSSRFFKVYRDYLLINTYSYSYTDYILNLENRKILELSYDINFPRKKIAEFFGNDPELVDYIKNLKVMANDEALLSIVRKYEELKSNK